MALLRKMTYQKKALNHMEPVLMSIGVVLGAKSSTQSIGWLKLHITFCGKATDDKALERKITKDKALNHITSMVTSFGAVLGAKSSTQSHKRTLTHTPFAVPSCCCCSRLLRALSFSEKSHALSCQWMARSCVHKRSPGQCANEPDVIRCNTLQYTAIHCNTLLYTAIHGNTMRNRVRFHPQKSPTSSTNEPYIIPLAF